MNAFEDAVAAELTDLLRAEVPMRGVRLTVRELVVASDQPGGLTAAEVAGGCAASGAPLRSPVARATAPDALTVPCEVQALKVFSARKCTQSHLYWREAFRMSAPGSR